MENNSNSECRGSRQAKAVIRSLLLIYTLLLYSQAAFSQEGEKKPILDEFEGSISVTNNGISIIPTFSLGDPAIIFELQFTKGKFSFEPEMRFGLDGKPWSFVFWGRYQLVENERFELRIGAHPALNFRTITVVSDGVEKEIIQTRRFVAAELATSYDLTDHISIGTYYLTGHGFDEGLKQSHYAVFNSSFTDLYFTKKLFVEFFPQLYYLWLDGEDGIYTSTNVSLNKKDFPISIEALFNIKINSEIVSDDFIWNISLVYSF